jgi:hypothetical protein
VRKTDLEGPVESLVEDRLSTLIRQLRADMNDGSSALRQDVAKHARDRNEQILATQRLLPVLHEDVIERLSRIGKS